MLIKNSLRLLINNLNVVFKAIVYSLVIVLLSYLLFTVFFSELVGKVANSDEFQNILDSVKEVWHSFLQGNIRPDVDFVAGFNAFTQAVERNIANYIWPLIGLTVGFYIISVLNNVCAYTLTSMMNARMSTYEKKSFLASLISGFTKALPFELWHSLLNFLGFSLSAVLGLLFIVYTFSELYITSIIIGIWIFTLLYSVYSTYTALLRPLSVNEEPFKNLFKNRYTHRDFWQVLATYAFSLLLFASINVAMFITTLGAGLIISMPLTQLFFVLLQLVLLYSLEGKKYYVDYETIVVPNKLNKDAKNADFLSDVEM